MGTSLFAISLMAQNPERLAAFWTGLGGWQPPERIDPDDFLLPSTDPLTPPLRIHRTSAPKNGQNRSHLHLTSAEPGDQQATVARALKLGGRHVDVGQEPDAPHVVLADPEGNEFCVIPAGNAFLAGCGFVGELACDGSEAVGRFWSAALDWPLVWDQDQETAVQSPRGGTKISWGGPPLMPRTGPDRFHLELVAGEHAAEVDRLLALGATRTEGHDRRAVALADPDGNLFCVLPPL